MRRIALLLTLLLLFVPGLLLAQSDTDDDARVQGLQLTLYAQAIQDDQPETASLLAIRALQLAYVPQAMEVLSMALPLTPALLLPEDGRYYTDAIFTGMDTVLGLENTGARHWNIATGELLYAVQPPLNPRNNTGVDAWALALSPDQRQFVVIYITGDVIIYDVATGQQLRQLEDLPNKPYKSVQFTSDGDGLLLHDGCEILLYNLANDTILLELALDSTLMMQTVVISPDGQLIATDGGTDSFIQLYDAKTGDLLHQLAGHAESVTSLAFNSNGTQLVSGSADHTARVWNMDNFQTDYIIPGMGQRIRQVAFMPDDVGVLVADSDALAIYHWPAQSRIYTLYDGYGAIAVNPALDTLVLGVRDGLGIFPMQTLEVGINPLPVNTVQDFNPIPGTDDLVYSWQTHLGEHQFAYGLRRINARTGEVVWQQSLAGAYLAESSSDGRYVVTGYFNGNTDAEDRSFALVLHDATTGEIIRDFTRHDARVNAVAFSPDGSRLYSTAPDAAFSRTGGTLRAWDVATGAPLFNVQVRAGNDLAVSPDGEAVAFASLGVSLYDLETGASLPGFFGAAGFALGDVLHIAYSPDTSLLLTGDDDKVVRLWDVAKGDLLYAWPGHTHNINAIAFSPDGRYVASAGADGRVIVWDVLAGTEVVRFLQMGASIEHLAFTFDSTGVISIARDDVIRIWPLNVDSLLTQACARLLRDLTPEERFTYGLAHTPTCT